MGADRAADAEARTQGPAAGDRISRSDQCGTVSGALGLRLADAARGFRPLADGLRLVPRTGAALPVPNDP